MIPDPLVTVLIPSHDHGALLEIAAGTALRQTVQSLELLIVLDGADDATRRSAQRVAAADSRARVFDFPKGERNGEAHRHHVLAEARGRFVCYLADDDLWFPDHVQTMLGLLESADFAAALSVFHLDEDTMETMSGDIGDPVHRRRILEDPAHNFFGLSQAGHTREAYALTPGWHPEHVGGIPTDLHMWRHFLELEAIRAASSQVVTVFTFPSPRRVGVSLSARREEMERWRARLDDEAWVAAFRGEVGQVIQRGLNRAGAEVLELKARVAALHRRVAELEARKGELEAEVSAMARAAEEGRLARTEAEAAAEAARNELDQVRGSLSYRAARRLAAIPGVRRAGRLVARLLTGNDREHRGGTGAG